MLCADRRLWFQPSGSYDVLATLVICVYLFSICLEFSQSSVLAGDCLEPMIRLRSWFFSSGFVVKVSADRRGPY